MNIHRQLWMLSQQNCNKQLQLRLEPVSNVLMLRMCFCITAHYSISLLPQALCCSMLLSNLDNCSLTSRNQEDAIRLCLCNYKHGTLCHIACLYRVLSGLMITMNSIIWLNILCKIIALFFFLIYFFNTHLSAVVLRDKLIKFSFIFLQIRRNSYETMLSRNISTTA